MSKKIKNNGLKGTYYSNDRNLLKMMKSLTGEDDEQMIDIPNHQRNYVWNDKDAADLLRSLVMGYPLSSITVNNVNKNKTIELQDGLQRHFSIRRLFLIGYKYINAEILNAFVGSNKYNDELVHAVVKQLENYIEEQEDLLLSDVHSEVLLYDKFTDNEEIECFNSIKDMIRWITNVNFSDSGSDNKLGENSMMEIAIPHIYVEGFKSEDIKEIFTLLNTKGRNLSSFEKLSSGWAKNIIELKGNSSEIINRFTTSRKANYYNAIMVNEEQNPNLVKFEPLKITPSNYMLAVLDSALSNTILRDVFLDKNGNLKPNAIEAGIELIKRSMPGLTTKEKNKIKMNEVGNIIKDKITLATQIEEHSTNIRNSFSRLSEKIKILNYMKGNSKDDFSLKIKPWFIALFIITTMRHSSDEHLEYLDEWFLYELTIGGNFEAATKSYAHHVLKEDKYIKALDSTLSKKYLKQEMGARISSEKVDRGYQHITRFAEVVLSIIQGQNIPYSKDTKLQIDHFIPQQTFKNYDQNKINRNTLFNLSLLSAKENFEKLDQLDSSSLIKYDFIYSYIISNDNYSDDGFVSEYENLYKLMLLNSYHYEMFENEDGDIAFKTKNGKKVKSKREEEDLIHLINFLEKREEVMLNIMCKHFDSYF